MTSDELKIERALNHNFFKEVAAHRITNIGAWDWAPEYNFRATYISLDRMEMVGLSEKNVSISVPIGKRELDWALWSQPVARREAPELTQKEPEPKTHIEVTCDKCGGSGSMAIAVTDIPAPQADQEKLDLEKELKEIREREFRIKGQLRDHR